MAPVNFSRGPVTEGLVRPFMVVVPEIRAEAGNQIFYGLIVFEVNVFILYRAPQAFDHDVVCGSSLTVHADLYLVVLQDPGERRSRVLGALVRVEDLRMRMLSKRPLNMQMASDP